MASSDEKLRCEADKVIVVGTGVGPVAVSELHAAKVQMPATTRRHLGDFTSLPIEGTGRA